MPAHQQKHSRAPSLRLLPVARVGNLTAKAGALAALLICLAGCKPVGPNYNRPTYQAPAVYKEAGASTVVTPPPNPTGGGWQPATPSDGMLRGKWW